MWDGYLSDNLRSVCKDNGLFLEYIHTSGHAKPEDLKTFASAMKPKMLIPIHTFESGKYPDTFSNVKILNDGEVIDLNNCDFQD